MSKKMTCHIVFQTHWDREWYLPFEVFRHRLVQVMDRIVSGLEKGELEQFVLDGQMAALEDYFDVCEENMKEKVLHFIEEKKIIIGPWYVLADEFLVSGESLIRNMEMGLKSAGRYGESQKVGYLPDTFGHVSQMPQLLKGFGIDNAILWRGIKPETSEFHWEAPNGSSVFTAFLPEGYYQPLMNEDHPEEDLTSYVEKVAPYATTSQLLLTNGGDHLMPKHGNLVKQINELQGEVEFVSSTYEGFLKSVQAEIPADLPVFVGEMRSNDHIYVLPNVLSARSYLKVQNQEMEDELTGYTEPLATLAGQEKYPHRYLEGSWKLLLLNHPHDSICGCSIDEVHKEMETRTMMLRQRLSSIQKGSLTHLGVQDPMFSGAGRRKPFEDNSVFTVFNPHPRPFTGWVSGEIWLEEERLFRLQDENGKLHTPLIKNKRRGRHFDSPLDAFPDFKEGTFYELEFYVEDLSATSLSTFAVVEGSYEEIRESQDSVIENEYYSIELDEDGTLSLLEKETGKRHQGLQRFYSTLDAGDEYNYSPPVNDVKTVAVLAGEGKTRKASGVQELSYGLKLLTPSGLNNDRTGPSEETVITSVEITLTVKEKDRKIDISYVIDNHSKDQRLRVQYPLGASVDHTYSDTAFDVVKREVKKDEAFDAAKQKEVPVVVEPSLSFVRSDSGFTFYHRGLQEYQITRMEEEDSLDVALIRSVGWLSRDDLRTRGGGAGPNMETPDAQCIGTYTFRAAFEFHPHKGIGHVATEAHLFRVPPRIYPGEAKGIGRLVEIDSENVQWSSLRRVADGVELRVWNPTDQDQMFSLTPRGERVNFLREPVLNDRDTLKPKEIATYLIKGGNKHE
ncbi:glycoside hydrolase family 38 C-terminal domain-containing protein [Rossellomorea sp. DA94]|uniref:alpha-mannosidase n=1 Tax=Rossellomorea sp. DA94 TaxID=3038653 RepID=UPI002447AAF9|nr:glycoside hydrolase family 38 C-terminal domain-containing protein [Rossellomorea sp. DA94]WGG45397.1 glycoside hydrolase family 38 C-terminal domain-containing protein [Rossellomorea sp. DA94]